MKRVKLVKFKDGKFGVRFGWLFHEYQDFENRGYTWQSGSQFFLSDCRTDEETARRVFQQITDRGEVVSDNDNH